MSASPDLLWALTRKTNAFMVKRNGMVLSSEPGNLANKHSFKFSGLANFETVGVDESDASRGERPPRLVPAVDVRFVSIIEQSVK